MKLSLFNKVRLIIAKIKGIRNENLCKLCSDNIRGTCCYVGVHLQEPNRIMCMKCPEHIRGECNINKDNLPNISKKYNVILSNHPCKYLDLKTKMCSIYPDRLKVNPRCNTIRQGITTGIWHPECIYIKNNKKYKKGIVKVFYDDVKDKLCLYEQINFNLINNSYHYKIYKY